jgi:hypothetical protein
MIGDPAPPVVKVVEEEGLHRIVEYPGGVQ